MSEFSEKMGMAAGNNFKSGFNCCEAIVETFRKEAGVEMTGAGATYPYGVDPDDSNIRIAPSLPPVAELEIAMEVFCTCLKLAALEKLLGK